jgi:hypothetical protein
VLFVEDQVNSENITTMADIQANFQTNLEDGLAKLAATMDLSRTEVNDVLDKLTTTTTTTTIITEVRFLLFDYYFIGLVKIIIKILKLSL